MEAPLWVSPRYPRIWANPVSPDSVVTLIHFFLPDYILIIGVIFVDVVGDQQQTFLYDIQDLRKFIDSCIAKQSTQPGNWRGYRISWLWVSGIFGKRSKLITPKQCAVFSSR